MRALAIGDIHGRGNALVEVLKKANFDYDNDKLIVLGDVVDGGTQTKECVEELLKIKNLVYIWGNHDLWFMKFISNGWSEEIWLQQGGGNTLKSYGASVKVADRITDTSLLDTTNLNIPVTHQDFFNRGKKYYVQQNMLFVHGGFDPSKPIKTQKLEVLVWDRSLIDYALILPIKRYKQVFIGHTSTSTMGRYIEHLDIYKPLFINNLIMLDTGSGWNGRLTIMDINTKEFWQSGFQSIPT